VPRSNWGDLNGQLNALDLGERRFQALLGEYGDASCAKPSMQATERAAALMRKEISALPEGTYRFEDYLDNDGIVDEPLTIALDLTVSGDRMTLDFLLAPPRPAKARSTSPTRRRLPAATWR
jgi:N-methylhydantoinase B